MAKRFFSRVKMNRRGRAYVEIPKGFQFSPGETFVVKQLGEKLIYLSNRKPIRTQKIMKINLQRWKILNGL